MSEVKTIEIECPSCKGTGVYVGFAEKDGYGVQCGSCKGKGYTTYSYKEFTGRKIKDDISKILLTNPGIMLGGNLDFGGQSYQDWLEGKPFPQKSEMRNFTCPAWWYQNADYDKKPNWKQCIPVGSFSKCAYFDSKETCWARWDKEFGDK